MGQIGVPFLGFHDYCLVVLSILIAILASYVGLDVAVRVMAACPRGLPLAHYIPAASHSDSNLCRPTVCSHSEKDGPCSSAGRPICISRTVWRRVP